MEPETALWRAVILRAMDDAAGIVESSNIKAASVESVIRNAQGWFRGNSEGFQAICDVAGLESSSVRKAAFKRFKPLPKLVQGPRKRVLKQRFAA